MAFKITRERLDELLRVGRLPTVFPEAGWWAGRRAIGNFNIDLEHDDAQEIASKIEHWGLVESYGSRMFIK